MYEVGQVLYTILEDKQIVIPVRVIEQVTTKTIEGQKTDYKFQLPNTKNQTVSQEKFYNLYNDLSEAESYLINNAKTAIEKMVFEDEVKSKDESLTCNNDSDKVKIDLGGGQIANIDMMQINDIQNHSSEEIQKKT
jgi:hypothetical protein